MTSSAPERITLEQWDRQYDRLRACGLVEPWYGGPLRRHVHEGDFRLCELSFDNSPAALRLWNFLLTETQRLYEARDAGETIIGTMKDLGTVPVLAYALPRTRAFYPDGAWWIPCVMRQTTRDLAIAERHGFDESFCPVRAMIGACVTGQHFPRPSLMICSTGATCDDFSAIAAHLQTLGFPLFWWEMPHRRTPEEGEEAVELPGGWTAPRSQVDFVKSELVDVRRAIECTAQQPLTDVALAEGIAAANQIRALLAKVCALAFTAPVCPMPALELLIAQMLAIHFCSDRAETIAVLTDLLAEVRRRTEAGVGVLPANAAKIYWINPVADLRAMNLLEECGGRLCGNDLMFCHALDPLPTDVEPMEALARAALADPMAGSSRQRAQRICREMRQYGAEAAIVSRIPGASHCALEGRIFREVIQAELDLPVLEIEVPPVSDAVAPSLRTRIEALVETVWQRRQ